MSKTKIRNIRRAGDSKKNISFRAFGSAQLQLRVASKKNSSHINSSNRGCRSWILLNQIFSPSGLLKFYKSNKIYTQSVLYFKRIWDSHFLWSLKTKIFKKFKLFLGLILKYYINIYKQIWKCIKIKKFVFIQNLITVYIFKKYFFKTFQIKQIIKSSVTFL